MRAAGCSLWFLMSLPAQQAPPVVVGVPAALVEAVRPTLAKILGAAVQVEPITAVATAPAPGVGVYLLVDEWLLARGAAVGLFGPLPTQPADGPAAPRDAGGRFVLPFVTELAVAVAVDAAGVVGSPVAFETLALRPELHDRLGLVRPEVDGAPWLLAMQHRLARREGAETGFALWTTLDARAGLLRGGYAELLTDLAAGRLVAAVAPRPCLTPFAASHPGRFSIEPLADPDRARLGLAIAAHVPSGAAMAASRLLQRESLLAIAESIGVGLAAPGQPPLAPADGLSFWTRFESSVRGRGRTVEQLDDWLDLGFLVAFLLMLWLLLRSQRRREAAR